LSPATRSSTPSNAAFTSGTGSHTTSDGTPRSYTIPGLIAETTYYIRVRGLDTAAPTRTGPAQAPTPASKATLAALNNAPTTLGTGTPITDRAIPLTWAAAAGGIAVDGYEIRRATNAAMTTGVVVATTTATGTSYTVTGLTGGTAYYFQIRSKSGARRGHWVPAAPSTWTATTDDELEAPTMSTQSRGGGFDISFANPASTPATGVTYEIKVATTTAGLTSAAIIVSPGKNTTYASATTGQHYVVGRLKHGLRVSDWSVPVSAAVGANFAAPTSITPTVTHGTAVTLTWTAPTTAGTNAPDTYHIRYSENSDMSSATEITGTGISSGFRRHFDPNKQYYFQVRAMKTSPAIEGVWVPTPAPATATTGAKPLHVEHWTLRGSETSLAGEHSHALTVMNAAVAPTYQTNYMTLSEAPSNGGANGVKTPFRNGPIGEQYDFANKHLGWGNTYLVAVALDGVANHVLGNANANGSQGGWAITTTTGGDKTNMYIDVRLSAGLGYQAAYILDFDGRQKDRFAVLSFVLGPTMAQCKMFVHSDRFGTQKKVFAGTGVPQPTPSASPRNIVLGNGYYIYDTKRSAIKVAGLRIFDNNLTDAQIEVAVADFKTSLPHVPFDEAETPNAPGLPTFTATSSTVTATWTPGTTDASHPAASTFELQYATDSLFTTDVELISAIANSPQTITGLNSSTTYFVRVRGVNALGQAGPWSFVGTATTAS